MLNRATSELGFHLGPVPIDAQQVSRSAAERVLGPTIGIVGDCAPVEDVPLPGWHMFLARGARRVAGKEFPERADGTGVALRAEDARLAAVAEAVEAYCFYFPVGRDLLQRAAASDLGSVAVAPGRFAWPSTSQHRSLPCRPVSDDLTCDWCWAWSLTTEQAVLVPAALVSPEWGHRSPNDFVPELTSAGMACHVSFPHAALGGLCEVLERDALALAWYNRLPLTVLHGPGTEVEECVVRAKVDAGIDIEVLGLPTDGPFPVVLAVATRPDRWPHAVVGAACRPDPTSAALKAVAECGQVLLRLECGGGGPAEHDAATRYSSAEGAELLQRSLCRAERPAALPEATTGPADPAEQLAGAVQSLAGQGLETVLVDMTTPDVAATGYRVIRVLVPGMVAPGSSPRFAPFGAARFYDVPVRLGLRDRRPGEDELLSIPVPLA